MKLNIIICLNLICSLCPPAFGDPEAMADPGISIQVQQIVGSSDQEKEYGGGRSVDRPAAKESADEGPAGEEEVEGYTEEGCTTETPAIECPANWEATGQGCYKFFKTWKMRIMAIQQCADVGGHIAILDTEAKVIAMYDYLVANGMDGDYDFFWVGAQKFGDKYLWERTSVEVSGWSAKKNQPGDDDCVIASTKNQQNMGDYDIFQTNDCFSTYYTICQLNDDEPYIP